MRLKLQRLLHESASYDSRALLRSVRLYFPYVSTTSPLHLLRSVRAARLQPRVPTMQPDELRLQPHGFRLQPLVPRL